jgi:hypothetical protein
MTTVPQNLFSGALSDVAATLYTAPDLTTARVNDANVVNTSASDVTLTLWVPQGGSAGSSNIVLDTLTIPAKTTGNGGRADVPALRGRVIGAGGTIAGRASVAGVLTLVIDGIVRT